MIINCLAIAVLASGFAFFSQNVASALSPKKALITYSYKGVRDSKWLLERCKAVRAVVQGLNVVTEAYPFCVDTYSGEEEKSAEVTNALKDPETRFWISLVQQENGIDKLIIKNLRKDDLTDVSTLSFTIQNKPESILATQKLIANFLLFDAHKREIEKALLDRGIHESKLIKLDDKGTYIDLRTVQPIDFNVAYNIFVAENQRQYNFARAGVELAASLSWFTYKYYAPHMNENANLVDWQFNAQTSMQGRFGTGEAYRFDDNGFSTNARHIGAGTGYYLIARSNGSTRLESLLFSIGASSIWEYFTEYREVVSINDQISTGIGGAIVGETLYEISKMLRYHIRSGKANWFDQAIANIFGAAENFNSKFGKSHTERFKDSGLDPEIWSKFDVPVTLQILEGNMPGDKEGEASTHKRFGIDAEVVDIPLYEKPGGVSTLLTDNVMAKLMIDGTMNDSYKKQFLLYVQTVLAAYYNKNLSVDKDGKLRGYNFFVGPSVGMNYQSAQPGSGIGYIDELAQVNILGSTIDLVLYFKGLRIRSTIDVFGNFAMVRSYAFDYYRADNDLSKVQSVLRKNNYYYGWGYPLQAKTMIDYSNAQVGAAYQKWQTDSVNGRGRFYETETANLNLADEQQKYQIWLTYQITDHVKIKYEVQKIYRSGGIENFGTFNGQEKNQLASVIYTMK